MRAPTEVQPQVSFDEFDEINSPRPEVCEFDEVVERAMSRRDFGKGVLTFGLGTFLLSTSGLVDAAQAAQDRFGFVEVAANSQDTITVPPGFKWYRVVSWGDPILRSGVAFDQQTRGTARSQEHAFGDNNDGMAAFFVDDEVVLAVNNEYTNRGIMFGNVGGKPTTPDEVNKGMAAHGVSIFGVRSSALGDWQVNRFSQFNRRITPNTPMKITGPGAGHDMLKTNYDPSGTNALGTWNNCGNGRTPWGTYLTCEENFNGYFSSSNPDLPISPEFKRYGISHNDWGYNWAAVQDRFDIAKVPNEPNRAGYIVEIDPSDPQSTPKKHTALGRMKHENAETVISRDGRLVVYMGDDERGEFLYRYVSDGVVTGTGDNSELLEKGTLYVAKFDDNLTGRWIPLTERTTGMSPAEISILTRIAGSRVGATTMDRPEWVAVNPTRPEAYVALTNNKNRGIKPNAGGDPTPVGGPNPRRNNVYGQIVRWVPENGDHAANNFTWSIFALAGNPTVHSGPRAGSTNINAGNMFNSPDGMAFDSNGLLWIQTDGKYSNEGDFAGMGNNQMLTGDPTTGEIRRFLVGPKECEVTGIAWSPDRRTLFVGIQHPGEDDGESHWPGGGNSLPRSSVVAIVREDGAVFG